MTEQIRDTCSFNGKQWNIESWNGADDCIPSSKSLGFTTVPSTTADWEGRVDHFLVFKGQLFLFKIEVNLSPENKDITPAGARRETRLIHEPLTIFDKKGERNSVRIHEYQYFIFDNLKMSFTGELELSYPIGDPWGYPWPLGEEDLEPIEFLTLYFEKGVFIEVVE